ncbi:C4-dicarboxylate transporter DcuC [Virgibacillus halodenitrificans]|uniref:C4-dicarboxylate transporter DcuC n=1 Tax=Virgibacillus halodenitrificans TaxID=1482 RepID=UPI00045D37C1|nr:C4-dicarboxylate transporter DcuC [Virgibacillus halodenitrificans]MCG1030016.1 C4-dicarboxylate transporter DcuC [Virgibacillus halodenitrificans]CDQ31759.1 Putative cryptic C4-dicarboxylate transporter DcuD [Virgibacillus halodenitrificans]
MLNDLIMYASAILAVAVVVYMLIKKMDIKIALFLMGIILILVSLAMGNDIALKEFESTGSAFLDPLQVIVEQFKSTFAKAGLIILMLGGYTAYMSSIGANDITVQVLTRPISKIKSVYFLVPIVFLLGNLLSLVIPSASTLAILLLATLYPVLKRAGMSTLSIAAIIATSATIIPTPLGSDNVAIAEELALHPAFANLTVTDYVFNYHAMISLPTLLFIAIVHYFWQKRMDKRSANKVSKEEVELKKLDEIKGGKLYKTVYAILPIFPIILLLISFALELTTGIAVTLSVEIAVIVSLILAIICELIRKKGDKKVLSDTESFFEGMGRAIPIVALIVAASVFVTGLQSIGLIEQLQESMQHIQGSGFNFILPLILVAFTALIVLLSGSGIALFFAMVPLMVPLADAAGINPIAISIPMGLAGNLFRSVSPVAAVVLIIAGTLKVDPLDIIKRTSVPMISGVIFMFILSMIVFL